MPDLTEAERYAIQMVADGAESHAEDDLNEDGALSDAEHDEAMTLGCSMARVIADNPEAFMAWYAEHRARPQSDDPAHSASGLCEVGADGVACVVASELHRYIYHGGRPVPEGAL